MNKINFLILCFLFFSRLFSIESYSAFDAKGVPFDHKIIDRLNVQRRETKGVFIEVGANQGIVQSNTMLLEKYYGWTGILIEPSYQYEALCVNRPKSKCIQCALGSFEEEGVYIMGDFDGHLMGGIGGKRSGRPANISVLVRSLQSILDEENLQNINFFSLDVEGHEYNVLNGIDFNKTTFDYILIEIYSWDYVRIVSFLSERGYDMIEPFSFYTKENSPGWDGSHNDYLFKRRYL